MRAWAKANPDALMRYLQGYIEGLRWAKNKANKTEAVAMLVKRLKMAPDVAALSYDLLADPKGGFTIDARLDPTGFNNVLGLRAEIEGQWGGTPPAAEKYLDLSYYARALSGL